MKWGFYLWAIIFLAETWHVLSKKEYFYGRTAYLFFNGAWLAASILLFFLRGDIKNWQHWIGFIIYLIVAICYWTVFKKGKTDQNASSGNDCPRERRFYQKITDIYTTAVDYSFDSQITKDFFATVQNKLHYAVHGNIAAS